MGTYDEIMGAYDEIMGKCDEIIGEIWWNIWGNMMKL
jgi:hypothetical protein